MRKLLLASLLFASTVQAQTYNCTDFVVYQGTGKGTYKKIDTPNKQTEMRVTIKTTEPVIEVSVDDTEIPVTQFWKDYNIYRNDNGTIKQNGDHFIVQTSVPDPDNKIFIPIQIVYICK